MAVFAYRAARPDGTTFEGHIEGEDEHLVRAKLESDGLLVFRLSRRGAGFGVPGLAAGRWGKLPLQDFLVFNQELLALIKAGLPSESHRGTGLSGLSRGCRRCGGGVSAELRDADIHLGVW